MSCLGSDSEDASGLERRDADADWGRISRSRRQHPARTARQFRRSNPRTAIAAASGNAERGWPAVEKMYMWMYNRSMSKSYTVASARAKLAKIVDEVEAGKDIELTRRGKKVAVVMSAARYARMRGDRVAFMTAYETFREDTDLSQVGVEPSWAEGLRDRDAGRGVKL